MDERAKLRSEESETSGEGDFAQFKMEYPWEEHHSYRMLMQMGKNEENGNATLTMRVCDLNKQEWTRLVTWDLGYASSGIKTENMSGFLENYLSAYKAGVRNVNFSNIRGLDAQTDKWVAADSAKFTVNNSMDAFAYSGSYQFGSDGTSFYAITSGVENLCESPESGTVVTVKNASAEKPY